MFWLQIRLKTGQTSHKMRAWWLLTNLGLRRGPLLYISTLNCEETWACVKYKVINFIRAAARTESDPDMPHISVTTDEKKIWSKNYHRSQASHWSHSNNRPMRGQYSGHVIAFDQLELQTKMLLNKTAFGNALILHLVPQHQLFLQLFF